MNPTQNQHVPAVVDQTPADLLRGAADYIETYGWHQGEHYDMPTGNDFPAACILGALYAVARDEPGAVYFMEPLVLHDAVLVLGMWIEPRDEVPSLLYLLTAVADYNDNGTRTASGAVAALRSAAHDWDLACTNGGGE